MDVQRISPTFAHCGIDGGASAVRRIEWGDEPCVLVGSNAGRCALYSMRFHRRIATLWEDPQNRQIVALGDWRFTEAHSPTVSPLIWVHFRGSAVEIFRIDGDTRFMPLNRHINTSHYGFCAAVADWSNERFMVPEYENGTNVVRIRYKAGGEKCIRMDEKYLSDSYLKTAGSKRLSAEQMVTIAPFRGMIMAVEPSGDYAIFMAFEDSTVALYDFRLKRLIDFVKHPKHHQFVCWTTRKFDGADEIKRRIFFAVSTMKQAYLIAYDAQYTSFEVCCVIRKTISLTCTALELFADGNNRRLVAAGLSSGIVEIFSLDIRLTVTPTPFAIIDYHAGASITCMKWSDRLVERKIQCDLENIDNLLFVGCAAGKLSQYSLQ